MPTYNFRCHDCDKEATAVLPIDNRNDVQECPSCHRPMTRIYTGGHMVIRVPNPRTRAGSAAAPRIN